MYFLWGYKIDNYFGKQFGSSLYAYYVPPQFYLCEFTHENENLRPHKDFYMSIYNNFIHNGPKLEILQMSLN